MTDEHRAFSLGPAGPTSHSYFSQRLRLHYLDWGNVDAPPVLLVHGNRDHAHNWDWVAARLRDEYHVVAVDLRGHGDSQWAAGSSYGVNDYVYDIAELVHQQSLSPVRIVAHSLGGVVSLRYAGAYPEHVAKMVVVEGTGAPMVAPELRPSPSDRLRSWIEFGRTLAGKVPRRYESIDAAWQRMQEANPHLSPEQARHLTIHGTNQNEDGTYTWKFDSTVPVPMAVDLSPEEVRRIWANITCPVLLVFGAERWQSDFGPREELGSVFADVRTEVVEGAGHWVQHDQTDTFVAMVRTFLAE